MPYRIAGIDVHKAMLAVVIADVEVEGNWQFARRQFGATLSQLRLLTEWLVEHEVEEVVMESTAVLAAGVGRVGTRLAAAATAGSSRADHRRAASYTGAVESWPARPEAKFP